MARHGEKTGRSTRGSGMLLPVIGLVLGLAILAVPVAIGVWNDMQSSRQIDAAASTYEPYGNPAVKKVIAQARKWNRQVAGKKVRGEVWPWSRQLEYGGNASNCWIEIPAINCKLPVYKGTSESTLAAGAGIMEGQSLPVGGKPGNCVVTAHSGMPNERMFDGVRNLVPGDKIGIHPLGLNLEYEVEDIETVWPYETEHVQLYDREKDMLTLVTCTPYGVNDHRLLVHCKRIPWNPDDFGQGAVPPTAYADNRTLPLAAALAAAGATGIAIAARRRKKRKQEQEVPR